MPIPLHYQINKNSKIMAELIISVGAVLVKGLAVCLMLASCAAIYLVESRGVAKGA